MITNTHELSNGKQIQISRSLESKNGLLLIGDTHLSSRVPGFRADDYPKTAMQKLRWSLNYAQEHALLPIILGDLFDRPRDNANWLVGELLSLLVDREVLAIHGNHDCRENQLSDDDTFSIIRKSGQLFVLAPDQLWQTTVNSREVIIGGSCWGEEVPESFQRPASVEDDAFVVWITHHDISLSGVNSAEQPSNPPSRQSMGNETKSASLFAGETVKESANKLNSQPQKSSAIQQRVARGITPAERPGIDLIVNGHIHKRQDPVATGQTTWMMPGALVRLDRSRTSQLQPPSVTRVDVDADSWHSSLVEVPHEPFDDVFLESSTAPDVADDFDSTFVKGLTELRARRTESGAGLVFFLEHNLDQFEFDVAKEVVRLAEKVTKQDIAIDWGGFQAADEDADLLDSAEGNLKSAESSKVETPDKTNPDVTESDPPTSDSTNETDDPEGVQADSDKETTRQRMLF